MKRETLRKMNISVSDSDLILIAKSWSFVTSNTATECTLIHEGKWMENIKYLISNFLQNNEKNNMHLKLKIASKNVEAKIYSYHIYYLGFFLIIALK